MSSPKMQNMFSKEDEMYVIKRNGNKEIVSFDKILRRIRNIGLEADIKINYTNLAMKVIDQLHTDISTTKIDELSAEQCASMSSLHPDYNILAGRITISNHHKNTSSSFVDVVTRLYSYHDHHNVHHPILSKELYDIVIENADVFETLCDYNRDYLIDYFGFKTLERAYLLKINKVTIERPQHMWLRVAIGIHGADIERVKETYFYLSNKYFTHATPTLFNAGTPRPQLSSCFLLALEDDSVDGIYNTLKDCAMISKWAGGIGVHISNVRASGSYIRGTNGTSNGIVPMLRVFNHTAKYIDQGGNKRNGSFAFYLEPWHADIEMFLQMRKNHGDEDLKARDLFYALWIPDLFMERVKSDGTWTLVCPDECPGLSDVYGDEFNQLYTKYESENRGRKTMKARDLWFQILDAQMETGTPYLLYKDACNKKSNQKNIGVIKSSNLCVAPETLILTDKGHQEIGLLEGQKVNVWNGEEFSEVEIVKTGVDQDLIDVYTDDGSRVSCTPYHKFYIQNNSTIEQVEAKDLKPNDKIISCNFPVIDGTEPLYYCDEFGLCRNYCLRDKLEWLAKLCKDDGTICKIGDDIQLHISSIGYSYEYITKIKLLLQTCGIQPKVKLVKSKLKNSKSQYIHEMYRLVINSNDLVKLVELGFTPNLDLSGIKPLQQDSKQFIKILRVEYNNRIDDTFCFTEPKRHMGIFNGIITGQCTEILRSLMKMRLLYAISVVLPFPLLWNLTMKTNLFSTLNVCTPLPKFLPIT